MNIDDNHNIHVITFVSLHVLLICTLELSFHLLTSKLYMLNNLSSFPCPKGIEKNDPGRVWSRVFQNLGDAN